MNPSVTSYITNSMSKAKADKLIGMEKALETCGYTWTTIPQEPSPWLEVYHHIGSASVQRVNQYLASSKEFYRFLLDEGLIDRSQYRFYPLTTNQILRDSMRMKYLSTLDELLIKADKASDGTARVTDMGRKFNKVMLCMLWEGLEVDEIRCLRAKDYLKLKSGASVVLPVIGEHIEYPITDPITIRYLDECKDESLYYDASGEAPLFIFHGAGKGTGDAVDLSEGAVTMRVKRILASINNDRGTSYTTMTIHDSGGYHRTYDQIIKNGLPFYCNDEVSTVFLTMTRKSMNLKPTAKKAEFQKFIEYVRCIKGKDI